MPNSAVLLVHGIWDSAERIAPLADALRARGHGAVFAFDLRPNDGRAPIERLAEQVQREADRILAERAPAPLDLVGFSMGALIARYYLQRLGGKSRIRRFISISGPHAGTWTAYGLPFAGVRQMRPGSALVRALASDPDPFGAVEVHCLYTPWDLMILPPRSSILPGARSVERVPVRLHRWMLTDPRVVERVAERLR
jgi:triacylglycerol lipase